MANFVDLVLNICSITPADLESAAEPTRSRRIAERNLQANRAALEEVWPASLRLAPVELPMAEYLMSRDGALTARFDDGRWFGHCSVPKLAAQHSLARFEMNAHAATLLAPQHPQVIAQVLDKMRADQALIAIIPQDDYFAFMLALHDFSEAIRARRLWFAPGLDWPRAFVDLLDRQVGLPPPTQLIRVGSTTSWLSDRIQRLADSIIVRAARAQGDSIGRLANRRRTPPSEIKRLCVIGSSRFNLWGDTHQWLHARCSEIARAFDVAPIDLSDPIRRSNLHVAREIDSSDAVLSAEIGRADQPGIASTDVAWITLCALRTPMFSESGPRDRLMVCSDELLANAIQNGWPRDRIERVAPLHRAVRRNGRVTMMANLEEIRQPNVIEAYSSHQSLWDFLAKMLGDPAFVPGKPPAQLVIDLASKFGIDRQQLPLELFISRLVTPAWMLAVARRLKSQKIDFSIHGSGWESHADLQDAWHGPIDSAEDFSRALAGASHLLDVWPNQPLHPARQVGIDLITTWGDPIRLLRSALLASNRKPPARESLSADTIIRIVRDVPRMIRA